MIVHAAMPEESTARGRVDAFERFHDIPLDPFGRLSTTLHIRRNQLIISEGDAAEGVYRVSSGVIRLYKLLPDGRRQITGFMGPGEMVGSVLCECHGYAAEAVTAATLQRVERDRLVALMDVDPVFMRSMLAATVHQLNAAQEQIFLLGLKDAVGRLSAFLCMMRSRFHGHQNDSRYIHLPMSRTDIADYLGLTIESVSRALKKLKDSRAIRVVSIKTIEMVH